MRYRFGAFLAAGLLAAFASFASAQEKAPAEPAGMTSLFNGKDLTGWDGDPRLWTVKDGLIRGETTAENKAKGNTFLVCKAGSFGDFELRLSYRVGNSNNSGVQYRSKHLVDHKDNKWVVQGYQAEVRNDPVQTGFIYDEKGKRGRMCLPGEKATWTGENKKEIQGEVSTKEERAKAFKVDGWNEYVIICKGNNIKHFLNGVQYIDFTDAEPKQALKEGIIALQLHAGAPMWVEFKDVRIKKAE